jgi:hypothetical protein
MGNAMFAAQKTVAGDVGMRGDAMITWRLRGSSRRFAGQPDELN